MAVLRHVVSPAGDGRRTRLQPRGHRPGRLAVVVSGQVAQDERGELVGAGGPAAQAARVFENLRRCLAEAGASFADVVKFGFFVLDLG